MTSIEDPTDWHDYALFMQRRAQDTYLCCRVVMSSCEVRTEEFAKTCAGVSVRLEAAMLLMASQLGGAANEGQFGPLAA